MKKIILLLFVLVLAFSNIKSQSLVDNLNFDARVGLHQQVEKSHYRGSFVGEYFNFNMQGNMTDNISYRIRQRLNKQVFDNNNIFNATDFLYIDWKINNKWSVSTGKQEIYIGGYEYDYAPMDIYYYSEYCELLPQCYAIGASVAYNFNEKQQLIFQIANSPYKTGVNDFLSYNFAWFGSIAPWWKTIWSVNAMEYAKGKFENIIALGNQLYFNDFTLDLDFINLYRSHYKNFLLSDWNLVAKLNYNYRDFNFFAKGGYDKLYTNVIPNKDYENYFHIGGGVEYFPIKENKNIRLHAVYYWYDKSENQHNFDLGITYKFDVIKK